MDLTPSGRIKRAEEVVRDQGVVSGEPNVISGGEIDYGGEYVLVDDYRDLRYELLRLQAAVMGRPDPGP